MDDASHGARSRLHRRQVVGAHTMALCVMSSLGRMVALRLVAWLIRPPGLFGATLLFRSASFG